MQILSKPWFIALLGLILAIGTQLIALKLSWQELFPEKKHKAVVVTREEPKAYEWGFSSDYIMQLKNELENRLLALDAREQDLVAYEGRLAADRAEIEDIKKQVELMRDELMDGVVKLEADEQDNLKRLAKTYSTLTPDAAVNIFRELDDSTVVKILFFMKTDTVGAILQEMATANGATADQLRRAAKISDMLRLFTDNTKNNLQQNI
ncbi:hypothetical protein [Pelagicoccus sp. SDUM812003]|uniref:MotE family protein n=1 Tax=Pelagicoccus sp. SDUM812003 TaxID=3041267 RepID=UPI002810694C|nr:hypothetical protein [Pelagicoccus sp. SDUM812003]MDQ8202535.1 hypothetical protein [Pelagicoccus sp. SDUM812003]